MNGRLLAGIAGVALLVAAVAPALADYSRGKAAYEAGDFGTALAEWTAGAKQGDGYSIFGLGLLYQSGQGVQADPVQAHVYYNMAEALGVAQGGPARDALGKLMSPEQLAAARAEAQQLLGSREFVDRGAGGTGVAAPAPPSGQAAGQPRQPAQVASAAPAPAAAPRAVPQISVGKSCEFILTWQDRGSNGVRDVSIYDPKPASGQYVLGGYAQGNYNSPNGCAATVSEGPRGAGAPPALAPPARWARVWEDRGTGAVMDGTIWAAVPPSDEYVCLGHIAESGYNAPMPPRYACVHRCLVRQIPAGRPAWTDQGTGARTPVAFYPLPGIGGFVAFAGGQPPHALLDLDPSGAACGG